MPNAYVPYTHVLPSDPPEAEAAQMELLHENGGDPEVAFIDRGPWGQTRPALTAAIEHLRAGDVLLVPSIGRLAPSARALALLISKVEAAGATITFIRDKISTGTARGRHLVTDIGILAGIEAEFIRERQREGIAKAKSQGKYTGRAPTARQKSAEVYRLRDTGMTFAKIGAALGISEASAYQINKNRPAAQVENGSELDE